MNALLLFELKQSSRHWVTYLIAIILLCIGVFCGNKFNLSAGEGIYLNSPYTIGFMTGMLSLSIIFFAILFSNQLLFKEWDAQFENMFFALPISKKSYLKGKFGFLFLKTFLSFGLLILGFVIGQNLRIGSEIQAGFNVWHYLYPLLLFGLINCFFVCSFLFFIAYSTRKKLLVVVGGLLLYVLYMVLLVFSNSPFMSSSLPQSIEVQQMSSLLDPFGLSAYFFEARIFLVQQKNELIVPLSGLLLINRLAIVLISGTFLWLSYRCFSFSRKKGKKVLRRIEIEAGNSISTFKKIKIPQLYYGSLAGFKSMVSFARIDLIYLFKSVSIVAISILLVFYVGMEMYADIDKGIRLPENYASSGLLAITISENFHLFGLLILVYFINDIYWRSHTSGFELIEKSTYFSKNKMLGHLVSVNILVCFFTFLLIAEGIVFQISYNYFYIDWKAYVGVIIFNTFPLLLFSAFLLLINNIIQNRFAALGISTVAVFALATPLSKSILTYPLLQIFSGFNGNFSDFNGYGIYLSAFSQRLLFGFCFIALLWVAIDFLKTRVWHIKKSIFTSVLLVLCMLTGISFMEGYIPKDEEKTILEAVEYEQKFRIYESLPQPSITDVATEIQLYPSKNEYQIQGKYVLNNQTDKPIENILVNFHPELKVDDALFKSNGDSIKLEDFVSEIKLKKPLEPNEKTTLSFNLSYKWFAVNGHQSFNAIVGNGSFMRISNYFPSIGYQKDREIEEELKRKEFQLGKASQVNTIDAPEVFKNDFINLNMTVSTEAPQVAVGTGDLVEQWSDANRNYFNYKAENIPFRFAVSSAVYRHKSIQHKGVNINVYYTKNHFENVDHLLNNAKLTLDYCTAHFGAYPFKSINFVEVSSFTKGFAATAYPSVIFMTEDMIFHTNLESDKKQDVINELAGHELSHIWWGNSLINPDEREGASMLTETLAMYTEMMLYKKMYGIEKMMERIKIHQQIYDSEKGLNGDQPLYKVTYGNAHIAYSKGAIIMVKLSELIGEDKVNLALKNFLLNNQYPKKPTSLDILNEFYKVAPNEIVESKIDKLFKAI
ncbi:aminopeptidase [Aureisphaera sp. CAU 1614]|uniref:Aminopeptidase n=1 Tax=Halomarinibacterium sedimenti TaxID=2857106 RepID=A0A9X1FLD5_9FLAO|nr:M1 family aminopeptidase [Halomarinibacterium sedimenti]MBW2936778.1 aminopeptidase [Halomarinibacterium sedimenti]